MNSPQPGADNNGNYNGMMMYGQQGDQQAAQGAYLNMGYLNNQSQAAAHAHATAAMAERRLEGYGGSYPQYDHGGAYGQPQQQYPPSQDGGQQYMDTNRLIYQRLQHQQQQPPQGWMNYGQMPPDNMAAAENGYMAPWSTTSAGLFGKMNPANEDKKKVVRKKHKDKPKRPLSAYNIFFKEERARILESIPTKTEKQEGDDDDTAEGDKKGGRKRKKTPHGKIGFENLAKMIGQRWQEINKEDKADKYKKLAAEDMKRYKEQMEIFLTKLEEEKKKQEAGEEDSAEEPQAKRVKTEGGEV